MLLHRGRIKGRQSLQPFPSEVIDRTLVWIPRYRWKIATRPETQITHTRDRRQSLAPVDINTRGRNPLSFIDDLWFALGAKASWSKITNGKQNYRVLPKRNLEATGAVEANLRPFSFGGSVGPLVLSHIVIIVALCNKIVTLCNTCRTL